MQRLEFLREEKGVAHWHFIDPGGKLRKPPREERIEVNDLIVSDVHFGSTVCKSRALLATLNTFWIRQRLIGNGDLIQGSNVKRLSDDERNAFKRIHKLGNPESDTHVEDIWVRGNHDEEAIELIGALFGLCVCNEYRWECGGKKYLAIHGDQWDHFVSRRPGLTRIVIAAHECMQRLDPHNRHILRFVSQQAGYWNRECDRVARGAVEYAHQQAVEVVLCGHVHHAERRKFAEFGIEYINSGSWTQDPCGFITVTEAGPLLNLVHLS